MALMSFQFRNEQFCEEEVLLITMEREAQKEMDFSGSTVLDNEFDVIVELRGTVDELDDELGRLEAPSAKEKVPYLRFLIKELEDALSGEYEWLRHMRFITKKTPI
jgi:hypothetical protein